MGNNVELLLIPQETSPNPEDRLLAALRLFGMAVWPGEEEDSEGGCLAGSIGWTPLP